MRRIILSVLFTATAAVPAAADVLELDQLMAAFGWDFESAEIRAEKISDGFYVLFGVGGNILVSTGVNGTLLVDDQFPQLMPKIEAAIADLGGKSVDFVVNTHWHFDHAEGNLALGPTGTWLVAHENSRAMMADEHIIDLVAMQYQQQAYPESAKPVITYSDRMQFHFNGEQIDLVHAGPAHTTGDTAVIFRGHNTVHMGDVFNNAGYPFIDAGNGGTIDGVIRFCEAVLAEIDTKTVVVPGHGPVTDHQTLVDYVQMLTTVRDRIAELMSGGADLAAVIAAKPTAEFDERYGSPDGLINRAFLSLSR